MKAEGEDNHQQTKEGGLKRTLPYSPKKETTVLTPQSWTSTLQNQEIRNFCCLSHLVCSTLVRQHQEATILIINSFRKKHEKDWGHRCFLTKVVFNKP